MTIIPQDTAGDIERVGAEFPPFEHEIDDRAGVLGAGSVLDQLRERRQKLAQESAESLTLDVPGYGGRLVARYRFPEAGYQPIVRALARAQAPGRGQGSKADLDANCDLLVTCCETLLGRDEGGTLVDLEANASLDESNPPALRFGPHLAQLFGIEVPEGLKSPARFVVRHVFSPRAAATGVYDGDIALMTQAGQVMAWLAGQETELGEEFVGE